eukprot:scaffold1178_cov63-Cylindrotheca_fusiformis.AAC.1
MDKNPRSRCLRFHQMPFHQYFGDLGISQTHDKSKGEKEWDCEIVNDEIIDSSRFESSQNGKSNGFDLVLKTTVLGGICWNIAFAPNDGKRQRRYETMSWKTHYNLLCNRRWIVMGEQITGKRKREIEKKSCATASSVQCICSVFPYDSPCCKQ